MTSSAKVICDSIHEGSRITTMEVVCHRFVLAEFNTHRKFSRNSASSRAIPVEKQLQKVQENAAFPVEWPCEQPGMQGGTELEEDYLAFAQFLFDDVRTYTLDRIHQYLISYPEKVQRLHKSLINRLLEPFMWHTIVVTSTEWSNFFEQRCSPLAQPEIRVVAELMKGCLNFSVPEKLKRNEWHLPYISEVEKELYKESVCIKASAARCARVSTEYQDGLRDIEKDLNLFTKLINAFPPHWSPTEHPAQVVTYPVYGNFDFPWGQLRHNMGVIK